MSEQRPEPLVSAEVDLRGLDYMPLYGQRLFGSTFDATCNDSEWRAGVTLWWVAWNQKPAGSLPNDDVALARLCYFGKDVESWQKVKERALRGFVECRDGRLYHPTLCEFVVTAWESRAKERGRKAKWRARQKEIEGDGDELSPSCPRPVPVPGTSLSPSCPRLSEAKLSEANLSSAAAEGSQVVSLGNQVAEIIGLDPARWTGTFDRLTHWKQSGYSESDILAGARAAAEKALKANRQIGSFKYLDGPIRDAHRERLSGSASAQDGKASWVGIGAEIDDETAAQLKRMRETPPVPASLPGYANGADGMDQ